MTARSLLEARIRLGIAVSLVGWIMMSHAEAQIPDGSVSPVKQHEGVFLPTPRPISELPGLQRYAGKLVYVDLNGRARLLARFVGMTGKELVVLSGGVRHAFPIETVRRLSLPQDSLTNGTVIGMLAGALIGGLVPCDTCTPAQGALAGGAVGAGVGALADARRRGVTTIYPVRESP